MIDLDFTFKAELWVYPGKAAWYFITLPKKVADEIRFFAKQEKRKGFGSVRVKAQIGKSTWKTSVFPDTQSGSYLLPVKAAIRKAEKLQTGDAVRVKLTVDFTGQ